MDIKGDTFMAMESGINKHYKREDDETAKFYQERLEKIRESSPPTQETFIVGMASDECLKETLQAMKSTKKKNEFELLPCPICDKEVDFHPQEHHMENFWNKNTIICPECGFRMEGTSKLELFKRFNTRKPVENLIARMEVYKSSWEDESFEDRRMADAKVKSWSKAIELTKNLLMIDSTEE